MSQEFPSVPTLVDATIHVVSQANGPIKNEAITQAIISYLKLSPELVSVIHSGNRTELDYRLAWARTNAAKKGAIVRVAPSTWALNPSH